MTENLLSLKLVAYKNINRSKLTKNTEIKLKYNFTIWTLIVYIGCHYV